MSRSIVRQAARFVGVWFLLSLPGMAQPDMTLQAAGDQLAGEGAPPVRVAQQDGPAYVVSAFELAYFKPLQFLLDLEDVLVPALESVEIELGRVDGGYVAPRAGVESVTIEFRRITEEGQTTIYRSALDAIIQTLTAALAQDPTSIFNFFIAASPEDVAPDTGEDLRAAGRTELGLFVSFDGPPYPISRFELSYATPDHPGHVPVEDILAGTVVMLVPTPRGYVAWRPGVEPVPIRLADMTGQRSETFFAGALQEVFEGLSGYLVGRSRMAVRVVPAFEDGPEESTEISPELADLRPKGRTVFRITIISGLVKSVRTLAIGERIPPEDRIDNEAHAWIKEGSPFQPAVPGAEERADLLLRDELDDYLFRLSRHPGRRVDAALAPARDPLGVTLDYLVTENKPLLLYAQTSNTGTVQTNRYRTRFGLFDNQITGNDDTLSLELVTAGFDINNTLFSGSYNAPFHDSDRLRWGVNGSWGQFDASEVGFASERFTGESWSVGGELVWNFYQDRQLFVDLVAGARYLDTQVDSFLPPPFSSIVTTGREQFVLPYVGVRLEQFTEEVNTNLALTLAWQTGDLTDVDPVELGNLGRSDPDEDWAILQWDMGHAFYLEPVLDRIAWEDITTPESSTLAHEIALRFRGQYAFDNRLIPQLEQVAGGLYSVRGYPESVVVGDTVLLGTAEYRLHVPRALGYQETPAEFLGKPFRVVPQHPYGKADWDLILRGFVDVGRTINSQRKAFEEDETLIGAGVGIQLLYKRNLDVRLDWGVALEEISGRVSSGSNRVHFVMTLLF